MLPWASPFLHFSRDPCCAVRLFQLGRWGKKNIEALDARSRPHELQTVVLSSGGRVYAASERKQNRGLMIQSGIEILRGIITFPRQSSSSSSSSHCVINIITAACITKIYQHRQRHLITITTSFNDVVIIITLIMTEWS